MLFTCIFKSRSEEQGRGSLSGVVIAKRLVGEVLGYGKGLSRITGQQWPVLNSKKQGFGGRGPARRHPSAATCGASGAKRLVCTVTTRLEQCRRFVQQRIRRGGSFQLVDSGVPLATQGAKWLQKLAAAWPPDISPGPRG